MYATSGWQACFLALLTDVGSVCCRQYPSSGLASVCKKLSLLLSVFKLSIAHFSENWGIISVFPVLGGNFFSINFGRNLDAHEPPSEVTVISSLSVANTRCLDGRGCYAQTLYLNIWACMIALGFSLWAGRRDWLHWQGRDQPRERMNTVVLEDTGEAVGPEDLES